MKLSIKENASLAPFCSMKAGGNAKYICTPGSIRELKCLLSLMKEKNERFMVLGNASNTLFSDEGFDGAVIFTSKINGIISEGRTITAECGAPLNALSLQAAKNSLGGLEFAYGIPGTVGGGVFMNAGAFGGELCDCFHTALCFTPDLEEATLTKEEMRFSYRKSILSENGYILVNASFLLDEGDGKAVKSKMDAFMSMRREKQPLEYPSCGSTFKRPKGNFAGHLIEQCDLKGYSIGGASVSEKHAGFIINKGGAAANDIIKLIDFVSDTVFEKTGVKLEPEIKIVRQR
ncbi:MAG: UDP-N-acetylmuramate dehydrogenase [Eubacteriales bacterium]|nr:UDP-N-acetylmuramate dehydrogenase [Eubacteriales bacterium]MDD4421967.1 UDP-N-acetylmuramate dehydrogenase [Eubacteriales bacterium]